MCWLPLPDAMLGAEHIWIKMVWFFLPRSWHSGPASFLTFSIRLILVSSSTREFLKIQWHATMTDLKTLCKWIVGTDFRHYNHHSASHLTFLVSICQMRVRIFALPTSTAIRCFQWSNDWECSRILLKCKPPLTTSIHPLCTTWITWGQGSSVTAFVSVSPRTR